MSFKLYYFFLFIQIYMSLSLILIIILLFKKNEIFSTIYCAITHKSI